MLSHHWTECEIKLRDPLLEFEKTVNLSFIFGATRYGASAPDDFVGEQIQWLILQIALFCGARC